MTDFHVLVPTATTNLITNPSFEIDANGWTAKGSTISRVLTRARFDRYSLKVVTDGLAVNEGAYFRIDTTNINAAMAGSIYIRGEGKVRVRIYDGLTGEQHFSKSLTIDDVRWIRIEVTGRAMGTDDLRLYAESADKIQGITFYIDGAQLEQQEEATTYCDGTLAGCRWSGVSHASTSSRSAEEMSGGIWTPIRDKECNPDTYVTVFGGVGMPPTRINRQQMAYSPGSVFDSATVEERVLTLNIWVKNEFAQNQPGRGQLRIKELRQILTDLVKLDVNPDTEPFMLKVTEDGGVPLIIMCRYEGGLEYDSDARQKWTNTIPLRLLCLDPFWEEDNQEVAMLGAENDLGDSLTCFSRQDNQNWEKAFDGFVVIGPSGPYAIEESEDGRMYFGGNFTVDDNGVQIRRFCSSNDDFSLLIERATGMNSQVQDIISHPNGKIYLCGFFTQDNAGNPFDRIAEYDPVANTFSALAGGIDNNNPEKMFVAPNGDLYVVGDFTTVDGSPMNRIAFWDGSWHTVGNIDAELGGTFELLDLYVESADEIYVVGRDSGATSIILAQWNGASWVALHTGTQVGAGPPIARSILKDNDGTYVYCGAHENDAQDNFVGRVWRWNGSAAVQLGEDLEDTDFPALASGWGVALHPGGNIFVSGLFDTIGDLKIDSPIVIWNGSSFVPTDLAAISNNSFGELMIRRNGDVYVSVQNGVDNVSTAAITVVENISTADVFPILSITGTGRLVRLENFTTGQKVFLNYTLEENEILTLDFREGKKSVTSNYRGSVPDAILPNSDDFFLAAGNIDSPKENRIGFLIVDEVDPEAQLRYTATHWSIDAGAS